MRVAIIADIHGNQIALEAVLADLARQPAVDQLVIAGDLCLNGPRPKEVLTIIQELHCPVVQGNVDAETAFDGSDMGPKKQSIIAWTREQIGQHGIDYLASLPPSYLVTNPHGSDLLVVHANPLNLEDVIAPNSSDATLEPLLSNLSPNVGALAFGHLHIAYIRRWRHLLLCDVGSCGLPRDEDIRASYGILSWQEHTWQAEIRRVPYDVKKVMKQFKQCGMPKSEKRSKILLAAKY
jgi:putative phosphoesterase